MNLVRWHVLHNDSGRGLRLRLEVYGCEIDVEKE